MTKTRYITLGKPEKGAINEDAAIAQESLIAVSDGAGGGGLFADRWSHYMLKHLPSKPITSFNRLDEWIGDIWEPYYNKAELSAKRLGGMALDKFYDEGSFATLAAAWKLPDNTCRWMSYGDSVVFHYNYHTKRLNHSFSSLSDFGKPPYLINCKDELMPDGFRSSAFTIDRNSLVFIASDALAHYIIMMYELSQEDKYASEINTALCASTKNCDLLQRAKALDNSKFEKTVIEKIRLVAYDKALFRKWIQTLLKNGILALDDYSLAIMYL